MTDSRESMCPHGLVGFCPDCRPEAQVIGEVWGAPRATVRQHREDGMVVVQRIAPEGHYGWFTFHLTRWGARRAARAYERTGRTFGRRP